MEQKYEMMITYLFLVHQRSELEGYIICRSPVFNIPSLSHMVQYRLSASHSQCGFSDHANPAIPISNSENTQDSLRKTRNQERKPGAHPSPPCLPILKRKKITPILFINNDLSTNTNQSINALFWRELARPPSRMWRLCQGLGPPWLLLLLQLAGFALPALESHDSLGTAQPGLWVVLHRH